MNNIPNRYTVKVMITNGESTSPEIFINIVNYGWTNDGNYFFVDKFDGAGKSYIKEHLIQTIGVERVG